MTTETVDVAPELYRCRWCLQDVPLVPCTPFLVFTDHRHPDGKVCTGTGAIVWRVLQ